MTEPTQTHTPLTPAQVEVLEAWLTERREKLESEIEQRIADAITPLQETIAQLKEELAAAIKYGGKIALRAANGKIVCAAEGGPAEDDKPFAFVSRSTVQSWESFGVERGQQ